MGIFKRLKESERQIDVLQESVAALSKKVAEIDNRLPEYEEAVARGVDDVWNKAMTDVANYDPLSYMKKGDINA